MRLNNLYYFFKPLLPRRAQLVLRRSLLKLQMQKAQQHWPILETASQKPEGWNGWPDGKKFAVVITHDVESLRGLKKCRALAEIDMDFGFKSAFNIVPRKYIVPTAIRWWLVNKGFEIGIHDYNHDGKLFRNKKIFDTRAQIINQYIELWDTSGFRSAAMHHNLDWIADLNISYDCSTFDTDPFEPQPDGVNTIFPFTYQQKNSNNCFVEIPYTLPQDFTLFVIKKEKDIKIWTEKLKWIAQNGGMATVIVHPDYINFDIDGKKRFDEYRCELYMSFLDHIRSNYKDTYWNALPREVASFIRNHHSYGTKITPSLEYV